MKYMGMPMGMWALFAGSFQKQLTAVFGYDADAAQAITKKAKPKYKAIIADLPEFEKADRFKMNIVNCAMLGAFILSMPQRPAVEAQGDEPLGKGVEVRITQEIEVGDGHHRRNAPQMYGERQRGSEAVVQVEVPIALCVNDIFMFRSVILQHPGQVLKVIAPERDRGRIESYFHNLILKNWSICQIIVIFIE